MYPRFKEVLSKKNRAELRQFVENTPADELANMLVEKISNANVPRILDELFQGFTDSEASQTKRRKIVEIVLKSLCNAKVTSSHVKSIINRINHDFPCYNKANLIKLVEFCHDRIRLNDDDFMSWKDILPLILQVLEEEKYINYKGSEVSGSEYKSLIVKSICNNHWESGILTSLAEMFIEMSLEKGDHDLVMRALCDKLRDMELNEIPPLVHQLLKLCSNHDSRLLLCTLQKYFAVKYAKVGESQNIDSLEEIGVVNLNDIQEIESTVLYHIYQAALLDHSRLKDYVTSLKKVTNAPEYILDPFLMALLLSVSNIYEEQIFEILKQAMCRKIQDDEKLKNSAWLRSVLSNDWRIIDVVARVISNSNKDRHLVLKSLVDFAFILMDSDSRTKDDEHQLNEIGIRIIQKLIHKRHEIGGTVLRTLTDKIFNSDSMISHYTDCLSYLCRNHKLIVLDSQAWVITLVEQLMAIPGDAAKQILYAILPLMQISSTIRDSLVLTLRKALYRKETDTRQMAVIGFLELLKNLKINELSALSQSGQSSSTSVSSSTSLLTQVTLEKRVQPTSVNTRGNATLCFEVLNILKRCFICEVEVREHLYKGLYDAAAKNPELSENVIDVLITHFNIYYETDENIKPPLKFHICSAIRGAEVVLQEPIGELIFVMQKIYIKIASKNFTLLDKMSMILESLCKRMTQTELEHLNLDEHTDLLDNDPKAQQKLYTLKLMITVYEALMAYRIGGWSMKSVNTSQSINSLFKSYNELIEFTKSINKPKKGDGKNKKDKDPNDTTVNKRGRPTGIKLPKTIMNLDTIHKILCLLYEPSVPWTTKEQSAILKKRPEFHHYILQTTIQLIQNVKTLKNTDLQRHKVLYIKDYLDIGELLFVQIISKLEQIRIFDEQTGVLGLECFKELCDLMCTSLSSDLPKFLSRTSQIEISRGLPAQIQALIKSFQTLLVSYFEEEKDDEIIPKKIPIIILDTMSILLRKISFENSRANKVFEWLKKLAETTEVETPIAVIFIQLLSIIEERDEENGNTIHELCEELCAKLGTTNEDEISIAESFKCLNSKTSAVQAHGILNGAIKYKLNNALWLLGRLKSEQYIASAPGLGDETDREKLREKERSLCRQLCYIIQMLQSLATAAIEPGPNTDSIFKNLQQLYKIIGDLTLYFYNKSTPQNPAFQSVKFVQLIELAGKSLKVTFYNLITHTEEHQNMRKGKTDNYAQRNKVIKETKVIPNVVFAIELFQKNIMLLSKKTGISLEKYLKHSITRDYRINNPKLIEGLEKLDVSLQITQNSTHAATPHLDETSRHDESGDSNTDVPAAKRPRLDDSS